MFLPGTCGRRTGSSARPLNRQSAPGGVVAVLEMTSRGTPSRFLLSVLHSGIGRFVPQLKRISIIFSRKGQSSLGVRDFIEDGVVDYAQKNPSTVVYVSPQTCRIPRLVAEYMNGSVREELLTNQTPHQISQLLTKLTNQAGLEAVRIRKPYHTANPSIQGQWHPFTHKPVAPGGVAET